MDLQTIRAKFLARESVSLDEERFFLSSIRRGYTGALETRAKSVTKAAAIEVKRKGAKGLDDKALNDLLGSI